MKFRWIAVLVVCCASAFSVQVAHADSKGESAFVKLVREIDPELRDSTRTAILGFGEAICRQYKEVGYGEFTRSAIIAGMLESGSTRKVAQRIAASAQRNLCPPDSSAIGAPNFTTPTTQPKLALPDNSGWAIEGQGALARLTARTFPGLVLQLGNAGQLGLKVFATACSGKYYESELVKIELLDASGSPIMGPYGYPYDVFGYSPRTSDIDMNGCDTDEIYLSQWPGVVSLRVPLDESNSGLLSIRLDGYL